MAMVGAAKRADRWCRALPPRVGSSPIPPPHFLSSPGLQLWLGGRRLVRKMRAKRYGFCFMFDK